MILIDLARHGTSAVKAVSGGLHARARHGRRRCDGAGGRARIPPTVQRGGPHCPRWQRSAGWSWSWGASLQAAPMAAVTPARPELRPHDRPCFSRGAPCPMPASHPPRRLLPASAPLGGPCSPRTSRDASQGRSWTEGLRPSRGTWESVASPWDALALPPGWRCNKNHDDDSLYSRAYVVK